jgi:hypothetical protein
MNTTFPRRWQPLVVASLLVGAVILFFGWTGGDDDDSVIGWAIVTVLAVATAYAIWRFVAGPRLERRQAAATPALVLGVLSVLLGFIYWTGIVYGLAPAAIALGVAAGADTRGRIGLVLGCIGLGLAVIGGFVDGVL